MLDSVNKRNKNNKEFLKIKKGAGKRQMRVVIDFN